MKIVILDFDDIRNPLLNAGQARATYEIGKRLVKFGHSVEVLTSKYPNSEERIEKGITYKTIGLGSGNIHLNNLAYILSVPFIARKLEADLILECFTAPVSTLMTPIFTKIPVIAIPTMFNARAFTKKYHLPFHLIEKYGCRFYKYFLPYTGKIERKMQKLNPQIISQIIPNGVGKEYFSIKHKKSEFILFLGRLDCDQKGIDLLLEAYSHVKNKIKYPLVIAGHGPDKAKIQKMIHELKLEGRVKLVGPTYGKKKINLISHTLFTAYPSRHDEMALWALESLASGLPIVCFDLPESGWLNEDLALKAKPFEIDDYAQLLIRASDSIRLKSMRKISRQFARRFSWDIAARGYDRFFQRVIKKEKETFSPGKNLKFNTPFSRIISKEQTL